MRNAAPRSATARPIPPSPSTPMVLPPTLRPRRIGPFFAQLPSRTYRSANSAFVASGTEPMLNTSIFMEVSDFEHLLRGLVQAIARAVGLDEIIIADHGEDRRGLVTRMHRKVHVPLNRHALIAADQRPFHQIVALAVSIKPQLRRQFAAAHVIIVALRDGGKVIAGYVRSDFSEQTV